MSASVTLIGVFGIFIPALMLPGPDFVAVVRSSMTRGPGAGLLTTLGVSIGLGLYAALSLLGLSAILTEYQWLAWAVRVLGGGYLAYLGIRLLFAKRAPLEVPGDMHTGDTHAGDAHSRDLPGGNPLLFGFLVTLTNPKAVVLFTSVFATSVTAATPAWLMGVMIALVFTASLAWYAIVSLFMSAPPVIRRFAHARHRIERAAGFCFVAIGGKILADARNPLSP